MHGGRGMTEAEFRKLAAIYGTDLSLWPVAHREPVVRLLAVAPEVRLILEREAGLDRVLAQGAARTRPAELARIVAQALTAARATPQERRGGHARHSVDGVFAAARHRLAAGIMGGAVAAGLAAGAVIPKQTTSAISYSIADLAYAPAPVQSILE